MFIKKQNGGRKSNQAFLVVYVVGTFLWHFDVRNHLLDYWGGVCILSTVSVVRVLLRHKYISSCSTGNSWHEPCCRMDTKITKRQLVVVHNRASSLTWPGVPRDGDSLGSANSGSWCSDVTDAVPEVCRFRKDLTVQCYQGTSWRRGGHGGFVRVMWPSC